MKKQRIKRPYRPPSAIIMVSVSLILVAFLIVSLSTRVNRYESRGQLKLAGLKKPVTVQRDDKGMAYVEAANLDDAIMAQGFITAQNRLFQMELSKLFATGRICELAGEEARALDVRQRTIGFARQARKHAAALNPETRHFFQRYLDGVNAYIKEQSGEHPLEFTLAGIKPEPWTIEDSLTLLFFMSWESAANLKTEIIAQMLVDKLGPDRAREIFPININPDDPPAPPQAQAPTEKNPPLNLAADPALLGYLEGGALRVGSNNWVTGGKLSASGRPILANDPHLDPRIMPGPWYPIGLITPTWRMVGVGIPGLPGLVIGRSGHIALGVTNAYGDAQDLYVETVDPQRPGHYLEGDRSVAFETVEEILNIKDKNAPGGLRHEKITVKLTHRGPVISGVLPSLKTDKVLTLRWAPFETMGPDLGLNHLMTATSVNEAREALRNVDYLMLNFVLADKDGGFGHVASGRLPIRSQGDGTVPFVVRDGRDNWTGWIPFDRMPQVMNPERGWVGTCNNLTTSRDYPYYYSSYMSPSYRQRRLKELLAGPEPRTVDDHWRYQRDTVNVMAREIAPIMAQALATDEKTKPLAQLLTAWKYQDDVDQAAPTVFQSVYRHFAILVFQDKLGEDLTRTMLKEWYFWQERLQRMVIEGTSPWFDTTTTTGVKETRDDLFRQAGRLAIEELSPRLGADPTAWKWGEVHQLELVSPIRRTGFGRSLLGGGAHPALGSGETLGRGLYEFDKPYDVSLTASLRMVADLGDPDKVLAVLPSGVSGRINDPYFKDQIEPYFSGGKVYWWFSDQAIADHAKSVLTLNP